MARNKPQKPLTEDPPEPNSSDEESSSSTEAEEEKQELEVSSSSSDDEDNEETHVTPPPPPATAPSSAKKPPTTVTTSIPTKKPLPDDSSDDYDEPPVEKLKPTKPTIDASSPKPRSEKRPLQSEEKNSSKKPRKEKDNSDKAVVQEVGSKKLFQRIFSEDDEIEILKGMIDFSFKKGADPMNDVDDFYGFIKKLLHANVNKGQVVDKIRRLKKKFLNAKKKKLTNFHDIQSFELSKKIWEKNEDYDGDDKIGTVVFENSSLVVKLNSKAQNLKSQSGNNGVLEEEEKDEKIKELEEKKGVFDCGEAVKIDKLRQEGLRKMGEKSRVELKEMWRKVAGAEMEVKLMRFQAQAEETRRIMGALKSN